jgi:hypothetical protein
MRLARLELSNGSTLYVNPTFVVLVGPPSEGVIGQALVQLSLPGVPPFLIKGSPGDVAREVEGVIL